MNKTGFLKTKRPRFYSPYLLFVICLRTCLFTWVQTTYESTCVNFFSAIRTHNKIAESRAKISHVFVEESFGLHNLWNIALLSAILLWVRIALKKFTQAFSYVVCTQARRHVHKRIRKRRYGEEKPGRFVFGKSVLFTLGLGLWMPHSLGILAWNFYQTFVTLSVEFWLRFEPQIRLTGSAINFLFVTARAERKVRLCVKLFDFFRGWILVRLTWNFLRSVPNSVEILGWNFREKLFRENFSEILCRPRLSSTKTCEIPA